MVEDEQDKTHSLTSASFVRRYFTMINLPINFDEAKNEVPVGYDRVEQ
jgi:hypothetical protein